MSTKGRDIMTSLVLISIGTFMFIYSSRYGKAMNLPADPGIGFLPMVVAVLMVVLETVYLVQALLNKDPKYCEKPESTPKKRMDMLRGICTLVLLALYAFAFGRLGFLLSSIIYLFLQFLVLSSKETRNWLVIICISIGLPLFCQILFVNILDFVLPAGVLVNIL